MSNMNRETVDRSVAAIYSLFIVTSISGLGMMVGWLVGNGENVLAIAMLVVLIGVGGFHIQRVTDLIAFMSQANKFIDSVVDDMRAWQQDGQSGE